MTTLFPLRESTLEIRGTPVKVRELTQSERADIAKLVTEDKFLATAAFAAKGCIEPKFAIEQAASMPADVIAKISREVMKLSGLLDEKEGVEKGESKNA